MVDKQEQAKRLIACGRLWLQIEGNSLGDNPADEGQQKCQMLCKEGRLPFDPVIRAVESLRGNEM